jgi:uncharacterized protein (TIGR03435 family)
MAGRVAPNLKLISQLAFSWLIIASPLLAQTNPATNPPPISAKPIFYQIVSIKPHKPDGNGNFTRILPDGYSAAGISLQELVVQAYGFGTNPMTDQELARQPAWFKSATFDINARVDSSDVPALQDSMNPKGLAEYISDLQNHIPNARMLMLQELLADRFHMKVHHEIKQLPVYALIVAKGGSKLTESKLEDPSKGTIEGNDGEIIVKGMPLVFVLRSLTQELGRPVLDKTGLTGNYDFTLKWTPDQKQMASPTNASVSDMAGPSLFTAIQEQLGLKLERTKGPVDTIVIDHVEPPTEN